MSNPNDPGSPPYGEQPDPTAPPADPGHSPASPPAWQQQQPSWGQPPAPEQPQQPQQPQGPWQSPQEPQQPPPGGWDQQQGWGQQQPPAPGGWQQPPAQQPPPPQQGAPAWDQPTQAMGWGQPPQQQSWDAQAPQPTQVWGQDQQQAWGQPPQQQSWQPPGYPGADQSGSGRSRSALPWIVVSAVVLILAVVGVLGFVTPGFFVTKVFDASAVQTGVKTVLTSDYKLQGVSDPTCPAQQEVKVGAAFSCTVNIDGKSKTVPITVKTSDGSYEVGRPT